MQANRYKLTVTKLSEILNSSYEAEKIFDVIFDELESIVDYDFGAIYYLNADRINLKAKRVLSKDFVIKNNFSDVTSAVKTELFKPTPSIFNKKSKLAKLTIEPVLKQNSASYIISKLLIQNTVFGFIIIAKNGNDAFKEEDMDILNSFASVISYAIKDSELSSVFRLQLKALQESIIEKSIAYKTIKEQNKLILEADAAKNEFLANISHELRTPLNAIIGFSEVLKEKLFGDLTEKQAEYVGDIHLSGIHLLGVINEILDISKIESHAMKLNYTEFDFKNAVNEVVNVVNPLAKKKKISIITDYKQEITLKADFQKIQQILFNLLSNAIKFTKEDGKIEIILDSDNKNAKITVKDNGIGIDKKYHGKIFGKFVQLHSSYTKNESSTGLGLTITKELVEMHGGKITLESTLDKGSTFIIEIPLI